MTNGPTMTLITALIRPHMEGHVVRALHDLPEFPGFTFSEVRGQGLDRAKGRRGRVYDAGRDVRTHQRSRPTSREAR